MGQTYSSSTLKVKLSVAINRMQGQRTKKQHAMKSQRREIAVLLGDNKDEAARIRVEALFREEDMEKAMDILGLMCELLMNRIQLISSTESCPPDLLEAVASVIFCASRVPIPELEDIAKQIAARYGEKWVRKHVNDQEQRVNKRILECLNVNAPPTERVREALEGIAKQYEVQWKWDEKQDRSDHHALGSVSPLATGSYVAAQPSSSSEFPGKGTLTVTLMEARRLPAATIVGRQVPYAVMRVEGMGAKHRTHNVEDADHRCVFNGEYFPFTVERGGLFLSVEVYAVGTLTDTLLGSASISIDNLLHTRDAVWYPLTRGKYKNQEGGEVLIFAQFMHLASAGGQETLVASSPVHHQAAVMPQTPVHQQPQQHVYAPHGYYPQQPMQQQSYYPNNMGFQPTPQMPMYYSALGLGGGGGAAAGQPNGGGGPGMTPTPTADGFDNAQHPQGDALNEAQFPEVPREASSQSNSYDELEARMAALKMDNPSR